MPITRVPNELRVLYLGHNFNQSLDILYNSEQLASLYLSAQYVGQVNMLPNSLRYLNCGRVGGIVELEYLPMHLREIVISQWQTNIDVLPLSIKKVTLHYNHHTHNLLRYITSNLPVGLVDLVILSMPDRLLMSLKLNVVWGRLRVFSNKQRIYCGYSSEGDDILLE
jgi:hypothetical protein